MMTDYQQKYYKYKNKYLDLKNSDTMNGGTTNIYGFGGVKLNDATEKNLSASGFADLTNCVIKNNLEVSGSLSFSNLTVKNNANIRGEAIGIGGTFNKLNVSGLLSISDCKIVDVNVGGLFNATNVQIRATASISGSAKMNKVDIAKLKLGSTAIKIIGGRIKLITIDIKNKTKSKSNKNDILTIKSTVVDHIIIKNGAKVYVSCSKDSVIKKVTGGDLIYK